MYESILFLALIVAAASSTATAVVTRRCNRIRQEKNRSLRRAIREQRRLARELEAVRTDQLALERELRARLAANSDDGAPGKSSRSTVDAPETINEPL